MISREEVVHISKLAKLKLKEEEIEKYQIELTEIINLINKLNELDTENIEPLQHPVIFEASMRKDILGKSLSTEEALLNAPLKDDSFFIVPKVIK